jgi:hypothetical protein
MIQATSKATSKTAVDLWKSRHSAYGQGGGKQKAVFHPLVHRLRKRVGFPTIPQLRLLFSGFFSNLKTEKRKKRQKTVKTGVKKDRKTKGL